MIRLTITCLVTVLGFGLQLSAEPLWAQSDLNGAWEIVEASGHDAGGEWKWDPVQPSLYIFVDGYYSIMFIAANEPRPLVEDDATRSSITNEQMRSMFMTFVANSGTYEVNGSSITTKPMVALWPNFMEGGSATYTYRVENDVLTLSGDIFGSDVTYKLRRLR